MLMYRDLNKLQEGIGEKIGMMFFFVGTFLLSLIVAFVHGWELTLVILCMMPLMAISGKNMIVFMYILRADWLLSCTQYLSVYIHSCFA